MKKLLLAVLIAITFLKSYSQSPDKPTNIYKQVAEKLASLKAVGYHFKRELNYPSQGYKNISEGNMYLEFNNDFDIAGFRFRTQYDTTLVIYNNAELFNLQDKSKTMDVTHITKPSQLNGRSPLFQGIAMLRNNLPMIIADSSVNKHIRDTTVNNKSCYVLQFYLHNKIMNYYIGNSYDITTQNILFDNKIIVDRSTLLPIAVIQINVATNDLNRTDLSEINTAPKILQENTWYYSTYADKYKIITPGKPLELIKPGTTAPDFQLTSYQSNATESLSKYKGKIVMLEFWIKNCGPCIEHVPDLNKLNEDYKERPFQLLAINSFDSKNNVDIFVKKNKVAYNVLYGNAVNVSKSYGVPAFPSVVIIDKTGTVIYSGQLDIPKIKSVINGTI